MLELVLWSFGMALTPWALGLAWKPISGVGDLICFRLSRALETAKRRRTLCPRGEPAQLVVDRRDVFTPGPLVPVPGPTPDERESLWAARPPSPLLR
jgi:hypothetical protein